MSSVAKEPPLVGPKGMVLFTLLGGLIVAVSLAWPHLAPQLFVTIIGVCVGIVAADYVLIRRESRLAFRSILTAPEAKGFLEGWRAFRRLLNDASHWWAGHHKEVEETVRKFAKIAGEISVERPKRRPVSKIPESQRYVIVIERKGKKK